MYFLVFKVIYTWSFFNMSYLIYIRKKATIMESFEIRVEKAKKDLMNMDGDLWENIDRLWEYGYSMRVIAEITGLTRSKIQRHISEGNKARSDDIPTQNRELRVKQTLNLINQGKNRYEIAEELNLNPRTVGSYIKQLKNQGVL